jgi:hypothetical protein
MQRPQQVTPALQIGGRGGRHEPSVPRAAKRVVRRLEAVREAPPNRETVIA